MAVLRENEKSSEILSQWPMERPKEWIQFVNEREQKSESEDMRSARSEADRMVVKTG